MSRVLVVGLNPAWQKILEFDLLSAGKVNRAKRLTEMASGEGLNAALILSRLGHEVWLLQILGGTNGHKIAEFCKSAGISSLAYEITQETRTTVALIDYATRTATELTEPFSISSDDQAEDRIVGLLTEQSLEFDAILYCGSVPDGLSPRIFWSVHRTIGSRISILGAVRSVPQELLGSVTCITINRHEFNDLEERLPCLREGHGINCFLLLTDGANPARMLKVSPSHVEEHRYSLPALARVLSSIGAGDTVMAGLAHFLLAGMAPVEACRHALAMGSASCLQLQPAHYAESDYEKILSQIHVEGATSL